MVFLLLGGSSGSFVGTHIRSVRVVPVCHTVFCTVSRYPDEDVRDQEGRENDLLRNMGQLRVYC